MLTLTRSSRDTFRGCLTNSDCYMTSWLRFTICTFMWHSVHRAWASGVAQFVEQTVNRRPLNLFDYVLRQSWTWCSIHRCGNMWLIDIYKIRFGEKNQSGNRIKKHISPTHVSSRFHRHSVRCSSPATTSRVHLNFHLLPIHFHCCKVPSGVSMFAATNWRLARLTFDVCCYSFRSVMSGSHDSRRSSRELKWKKSWLFSSLCDLGGEKHTTKSRGRLKQSQTIINMVRNVITHSRES